jgi:small conductance mechanosensitive channel
MFDIARLGDLLVVYGMRLAGAVLVGLVGWWLARLAERATRRALLVSSQIDPLIAGFVSNLARYAALILTFLVIIQLVGIQATSLVAVLAAASLAIGLALQGTLSNMAAGVMLLLFRPFQIGDDIEVEGKRGRVRALNFFITELEGENGAQILLPNGKVWGSPLSNFSTYGHTRIKTVAPEPAAPANVTSISRKD